MTLRDSETHHARRRVMHRASATPLIKMLTRFRTRMHARIASVPRVRDARDRATMKCCEAHATNAVRSMRGRNNERGALSISAWCFNTTLR
jgi:hypothetical protein